ncbi:sugar transporter [Methylobacterium tarhaniae]|uniref:Sugar transporter n=2 Tax=Methylobacterium tarhaniae TaxID=1187852 RepID=A0A0J6SHS3_9HYPH|nr:sugar transporter [Methylobacterium tarhaniae]
MLLGVLGGPTTGRAAEAPARYLLGPQDRVGIRVYDLRRNTGEAYSWTALNGEFSVGADGAISLPIIGQLRAAGGTPAELAEAVGRVLKEKADLAETPAASVEVLKYRPFYVTGAVQKPGKYEYQPGLTVLQAVSTAEGLLRASDLTAARREIVTAGGDARTLAVERLSLEVRAARLAAEIAGTGTFALPSSLEGRAADPQVVQAMRAEGLLFDSRRDALKAEIAAIEQSKTVYRQEIASLEAKGKALDRQVDLSRKELDLVNDLVAKGLTITPRKLAAEQARASYESSRLDVQVASLRAQQSLARAERDIIDLQAKFRKDVLNDALETRTKLDQNKERARTADRLVSEAEARTFGTDGSSENLVPSYEVTRAASGGAKGFSAGEDDSLEPGDVVRVTLTRRFSTSSTDRSLDKPNAAARGQANTTVNTTVTR